MSITPDHQNISFQLATDFVSYTNLSVFLTGKAGTGKTTFLKYCKQQQIKNTAVVAPTGVAAMNAGGSTIHSFFQLPFPAFLPVNKNPDQSGDFLDKHTLISRLRFNGDRKEVLQKLELLIIDEISMVRCDTLDAIDTVLKHVRGQYSKPFGGVQVLLIGDLYQLTPVMNETEWETLSQYYKSPYFFNSHVIESQPPVYIELDKIYRQKDEKFVDLLNMVRNNRMTEAGLRLLHERYLPNFVPSKEENYITLTTHNHKAEAINFSALKELPGEVHQFNATIEGDFYEKAFPADQILQLKIGAQVMFIKNDFEKVRRYYNGKIGIVSKIEDDKIFIQCKDEDVEIEVKKEKWRNIRYTIDKITNQIEEKEIGSFSQYPLRLAWAITIHKSQGLTFEKAIIDAGDAFAKGQVYVALSRCTNLEGIVLQSRISSNSFENDYRIAGFSKIQQTTNRQLAILQEAKRSFQLAEILNSFDFTKLVSLCNKVREVITNAGEALNSEAVGWINEISFALEKERETVIKFKPELNGLLEQEEIPELNVPLNKRLIAAANHFSKQLLSLKNLFIQSPVVTDNKTLAQEINKKLQEFYHSLTLQIHLVFGLQNGFQVESFLVHKRKYFLSALPFNIYAGKSVYQKIDSPHPVLYQLLRKKRDEICDQKGLAIYLVANSNSLDEMARYLPRTEENLAMISGFGDIRIRQFGQSFLSIINDYCEEHHLHFDIDLISERKVTKRKAVKEKSTKVVNSKPGKEEKIPSREISLQLYKSGIKIKEIAKERNLAIGTIEGHLVTYVKTGEIEIHEMVDNNKYQLIEEVLSKYPESSSSELRKILGDDFSYSEITAVINHKLRLAETI